MTLCVSMIYVAFQSHADKKPASPDGIRTFFFECNADGVNVRRGPGTEYPVATDKWGNKIQLDKGGAIMGQINPIDPSDWIEVFPDNYEDIGAYVNIKYLDFIMTDGIPENQNKVIVYADYKEPAPEDDETGCWQPYSDITYIWDDGQVVRLIEGAENFLQFGFVEGNIIHWTHQAVAFELLPSEEPGISINSNSNRPDGWERIKIYTHPASTAKANGILPDCKYFDNTPYLILFTPEQMEKIRMDAAKHNLLVPMEDYKTYELITPVCDWIDWQPIFTFKRTN